MVKILSKHIFKFMLKSISNENVFDKNLTNKRIYLNHFQMYPY